MTGVLFVCTGNICRSPTAEGIFRELLTERGLIESFELESCGLISYHVGEAPDERAQKAARARGLSLSGIRSRKYKADDAEHFELILAMDRGHEQELYAVVPAHHHHKIKLLLFYLSDPEFIDVPDPYYGTAKDFETAFNIIYAGCQALLEHLTQRQ